MSNSEPRVSLVGSTRQPVAGARAVGPADADQEMTVSLFLRQRPDTAHAQTETLRARAINERQYISHQQYADLLGASPDDAVRVEAFALAHNLQVVERALARRTMVLSGTVANMRAAFQVDLQKYQVGDLSYRGRVGAVSLPADLAGIVQGVFGLDDRPQARPHFRSERAARSSARVSKKATANAFNPPQLAQAYNFPTGVNGQNQCIAIIELGGGYKASDLQTYFTTLGIPQPKVDAVSVDGATNSPAGNPNSADGEVLLDIEVAGGIAPGAHIVVYFAPNTDQGFLDAITTAIHDAQNKPSVVSISWGAPESDWTTQALDSYDQAFQAGAALGVTILCASGDNGSLDRATDSKAHVDFPASSPNVLGCGGTNLSASGSTITSEVVWNDGGGGSSGGGISEHFPVPSYQGSAHVPPSANPGGGAGRGVPDIAGNADPSTGYNIYVDGQWLVFGGTSAVSPLWSGLLALINQSLGKPVGFLNPTLYGQLAGTAALHDITSGNNVVGSAPGYQAGPGWDACTGFGSPNGNQILKALGGQTDGGGDNPPPQAYPKVGVQFSGTVPANSTGRWYTYDWPAAWNVVWTVVPTSFMQSAPQISWNVQVQRAAANSITYWISVTNLTGADVDIEARYAVLGETPTGIAQVHLTPPLGDGGSARR